MPSKRFENLINSACALPFCAAARWRPVQGSHSYNVFRHVIASPYNDSGMEKKT